MRRETERSLSPFAQFMQASATNKNSPSPISYATKKLEDAYSPVPVYRGIVPERHRKAKRSDSLASLDQKAEKWARGVRNWHFLYQSIKKFRILSALRKIALLRHRRLVELPRADKHAERRVVQTNARRR